MAERPTYEPSGGEGKLKTPDKPVDTQQLKTSLLSYLAEAKEARRAGQNPRDDKWSQNLDLYWSRYDYSKKADWQARETMPEVPVFVDRFAAALKEALVATPQGFYDIIDPSDTEGDLGRSIKRMTDMWLSTSGRNQVGQVLPFAAVFEEQMKLGALMACSSVVTWKGDYGTGRVAIESVDPRMVWLDHTGRNLYRIRRTELDRHELPSLINAKDSAGNKIFSDEGLAELVTAMRSEDERWIAERTGAGTNVTSGRRPIQLDEFIATAVDSQGQVLADRSLVVMANEQHIIRGPEKNPFMHEKDWITFAPLVTAPLSVYGRSYMEDFGSVATTFNELTNMILDAVHTSSLNAHAVVPGMLVNPQQLAEGITPNKAFLLEEGFRAGDFAAKIEMGNLSDQSFKIWQAIKSELREAASINEIGVGQFAPKGRTSATEISETQQSSSALIRSVAQTIETRWLDPTLDLVWKTGLQHVNPKDKMLSAAAGDEMFKALLAKKREIIQRPITFQARGISSLIARGQMLKSLMQLIGVIGQNEMMLKAFLEQIDIMKLVKKLFELSNIDLTMLQTSQREKMIRSITDPLNAAGTAPGQPGETAMLEMGQAAQAAGIGKS